MTRVALVALLVLLSAAAACQHSERVGEAKTSRQAAEPSKREARIPAHGGRPAVAADPAGLMRRGSAKRIEQALRSKGYLRGSSAKANANELTAAASAALRRFQRDEGLAETGAPDRETLRRLGIDPKDVYSTAQEGTGSTESE